MSSLTLVLGLQGLFFTGLWAMNNPTIWIPTALRLYVAGLDLSKRVWAQTKKSSRALFESFQESNRPPLTFFNEPSISSIGVPIRVKIISRYLGWTYSPNSKTFSIECGIKDSDCKRFPYLTGTLALGPVVYDMSEWLQTVTYSGPIQPPLYILVQSYLYDIKEYNEMIYDYLSTLTISATFSAITDEGEDITVRLFDTLPQSVQDAFQRSNPAYEEEEIPSSSESESDASQLSSPSEPESTESASGATHDDERVAGSSGESEASEESA